VSAYISVVSSTLVGTVLVILPWRTDIWDSNFILRSYPILQSVMLSAAVRGAVTGLGIVNLLLAAFEVKRLLGDDGDGR
jgi:hypothetical protein